MTAYVSHTTIDCRNAFDLSEWWKQVLAYVDVEGDPNLPGHDECMILDPGSGHRLLFVEAPDEKRAKNRIHLDLCPRSGTRDEELSRLLRLGAVEVDDLRGRYGRPGTGWVVLADPESNEFCILRSDTEREAS